jgi:hypothetical protein
LPLIADLQVAEGKLTSHGRPILDRKRQEERKLDQLPPRKVFSDSFPVASKVLDQPGMPGFSEAREKDK